MGTQKNFHNYVPCLAVGGCLASSSACPSLIRSMLIQISSVPLSIKRTPMLEFSSSPTNCLQGNKVKPVLSGHSKRRQKLVFKANYGLMQVIRIAECSKRSILQYFPPSLSYRLSLRSLFCLFLSGRLRQVLMYSKFLTST